MNYDYRNNEIIYKDTIVRLTDIENEIFNYLYTHKRKVCSYEELLDCLYNECQKTTMRVIIYRMRKKLGNIIKIKTVYSKGFVID